MLCGRRHLYYGILLGVKAIREWPSQIERRFPIAVFLDRDGTINVDSHYPHKPADLELLPRAAEGLRLLSRLPVHIIVASNQAGIALGYYGQGDLSGFNAALRGEIERSGGRIDAFYFCPELEISDLPPGAQPAFCSKPQPGMLIEAGADFGVSLGGSFMIGDKKADVGAGLAAGCTTVLLQTGKAGSDEIRIAGEPHHVCADLFDAARLIESLVPTPVGRGDRDAGGE